MSHEEMAQFALESYRHGRLVAEANEYSISKENPRRTKEYRDWRKFRKDGATTKELEVIADTNFNEGFEARRKELAEEMDGSDGW